MRKIRNLLIVVLTALSVAAVAASVGLLEKAGKNLKTAENEGAYSVSGVYDAPVFLDGGNDNPDMLGTKVKLSTDGKYMMFVTGFKKAILDENGYYYMGYKYLLGDQEHDTARDGETDAATYYYSLKLNLTTGGTTSITAASLYGEAYADYRLLVYELEFETDYATNGRSLGYVRAYIDKVNNTGSTVLENFEAERYANDKFEGHTFATYTANGTTYTNTAGVNTAYDMGDQPVTTMTGANQYAFYKNINAQDFYVETTVNATGVTNNDAYPKFGLGVKTADDETVLFFIDSAPDLSFRSVGVVKVENGNWGWGESRSRVINGVAYSGEDEVTLGLLRNGNDLYFSVNGNYVLAEENSALIDGVDTAACVFSFNTTITLTEYSMQTSSEDALSGRKIISTADASVAGKIWASDYLPLNGQTVTFTEVNPVDFKIGSLFAGENEISKTNDAFSFTANSNVSITGDIYHVIDGIVLDNAVDAAYGGEKVETRYNGNRGITLYATKTENGLFMNFVAYMNGENRTDNGKWFECSNIEFRLNGGDQRFINILGNSAGITELRWRTVQLTENENGHTSGQYKHMAELFIAKARIPDFDNVDPYLNFAWRSDGEPLQCEGDMLHQWALGWSANNWMASHVGGLDLGANDITVAYDNTGAYSQKIRIGANGIRFGSSVTHDVTLDGVLDDEAYDDLYEYSATNASTLKVKRFYGSDGLYLGVTLINGGWSGSIVHNHQWGENDNVEVRVNGYQIIMLVGNGYVSVPDYVTDCKFTQDYNQSNANKYTTTIEMWIEGDFGDSVNVLVGANGPAAGINGWVCAADDTVVKDSIVRLDGVFDDACWTSQVRASSATNNNARGARVTVMGRIYGNAVLIGVTVDHNVDPYAVVRAGQDGTAWWHYMGPELRLGRQNTQLAATPWNKATVGPLISGVKTNNTPDSGYNYKTTFEIYVPDWNAYFEDVGGVTACAMYIGGNYENDYTDVFSGNPSYFLTANGMQPA